MSQSEAPHLSLVLACYNEAEHLEHSFSEIRDTLEQARFPFEIVFVDDVSRDGTREILARIVAENPQLALSTILHEKNRGRGATVTDGFRAARGAVTGYIDVDLEVHCRYVPSLVRAIDRGADVATLSRIYAFQLRSLDRYFMSRGYSYLVRRMLGVGFADTETGYKFFRRETVLPLLDEIGWKKALRFGFFTLSMLPYRLLLVPQLRAPWLRLLGARIGARAILHDVRFFNLYRRGLAGLEIGDECFVGDECLLDLAEGVRLEPQVTLAERVLVLTHTNVGYADHPLQAHFPARAAPVVIERGSFVGASVTLLPGVRIGAGSFVAAGSVVTEDVPRATLVAGVPARVVRPLA